MKSIYKSILVIAVAVFIASAGSASAYVPGVWDPQPQAVSCERKPNDVLDTYGCDRPVPQYKYTPTSTYIAPAPAENPTATTQTTSQKPVAKAPAKKTVATNSNTTANYLSPVVTEQSQSYDPNTASNITALSLKGSGGFMPSSIWQWLLVILLIFAIIVIARMLGKKPAHHDVHGHPAH